MKLTDDGRTILRAGYGLMPNDPPHMVRVMGAVDIPHTGVTLAGNAQYFTGTPRAASAQVSLPQGDQRILLEPRGTRRLSAQTLVDVRLSKSIGLGGSRRAAAFVDPRRAMFGVRLNVGR